MGDNLIRTSPLFRLGVQRGIAVGFVTGAIFATCVAVVALIYVAH